jgi:hypothetical protein
VASVASALSIREIEASAALRDWLDVIGVSRAGKPAAESRNLAKWIALENE